MICDVSSRHEDVKDVEEDEEVGLQLHDTTVVLLICLLSTRKLFS